MKLNKVHEPRQELYLSFLYLVDHIIVNLENIGLRNLSIAATNESNPTGQMNGFCAGQMQTGNEQKQSNLAWNNADTQIIRSQVLKKFPE